MINAIMKIGKWAGEKHGNAGSLSNFVQNPNEKGGIGKVFVILLDAQPAGYVFKDVDIEEFSENEKYLLRYLYRRGGAQGADITPTSKFAGDISKTFKNRIIRSIRDILKESDQLGLTGSQRQLAQALNDALIANADAIEQRLRRRVEELERREGAIVTVALLQDGGKLYIGDLPLFQKVLIGRSKTKYYQQYGTKSLSHNKHCSVCQTEQQEVYGFVNTYNFYTVDKPGFVTGGFQQQHAWKNYPVCLQCACNLELGKQYLNQSLNFNFYGFRYLLIPKFFNDEVMAEVLDVLEGDLSERAGKFIKASFQQEYINRLTNAEDEIFELFSQQRDYVSFDLLFYREKQAAFNVLLHVEDVLPSRFRLLFEAKARLDEIDIFRRETSRKDGKRLLVFHFGILRNFFPYLSKTRSFDEHFLDLVGKIFSLKPIDYFFVIQAIMKKLRDGFVQNEYMKVDCLSGYMLLSYLADLSILSKGGVRMDIRPIEDLKDTFGSEDTDVTAKLNLFFEAHIGFFDSAEKRACFLVGVLVQKLLNIQWKDKNATPFRSKLQGLRLDEALVKRLSWEAQNKLEEYGKNYYRKLENLIAQYMIAAEQRWNCTNNEISFYFTMGMNMAGLFKTKKEEDGDEQLDE